MTSRLKPGKPNSPPEILPSRLGATDAALLVVGTIIGAGIFGTPGFVAAMLPLLDPNNALVTSPLIITEGQLVAVVAIVVLSAINHLGIRAGALVQNALTVIKVLIFSLFIVAGLALTASTPTPVVTASHPFHWSALGAALIAIMFTYFGWDSATYVAGETKNPACNLPLAALWGTTIVVVIYVALNVVFMRTVPPEQMHKSVVVADTAARMLFGPAGSRAVTLAIIISILGGLNAMILTGPRVLYAMSRDRVFSEPPVAYPRAGTHQPPPYGFRKESRRFWLLPAHSRCFSLLLDSSSLCSPARPRSGSSSCDAGNRTCPVHTARGAPRLRQSSLPLPASGSPPAASSNSRPIRSGECWQ